MDSLGELLPTFSGIQSICAFMMPVIAPWRAIGVDQKDLPRVGIGQPAAFEGLACRLEPSLERGQVIGVEGEVIDRAPAAGNRLGGARQHMQHRPVADVEPAPGHRDGRAGADAQAQHVAIEALDALEVGASHRDVAQ